MNGKILLAVFLVMSLVGIARADVYVEGVGTVSDDTYEVMQTMKAINRLKGISLPEKSEKPSETANTVSTEINTPKAAESPKAEAITLPVVGDQVQPEIVQTAAPATTGSGPTGVITPKPDKAEEARRSTKTFTAIHEADHEGFLYLGGHYSLGSETKGGWLSGKTTKWWGFRDYPANVGAGVSLDGSTGETGGGYGWGYIEPGVNTGAYVFGEDDDFLVRLNFAYRIGLHKNSSDGFVPGAEMQYSHAFSNRFSLIAQVYGKYYRRDSHGGASLVGEYIFNEQWRGKAGIAADVGIGGETVLVGVGPTASVEYNTRYVLGCSLLFGPGGPTVGPFVGFKYTKYLADYDREKRDKSVTKIADGSVSNPMPEKSSDIKLRDDGKGTFTTLSWADERPGKADITLGEKLQQDSAKNAEGGKP